jgi:ABC-2 type transport system permease protein
VSPILTIWQVARREITERGKSRAYLVTSALTLLIVVGLVVAPSVFGGGTDEYTVGFVGSDNEPIVAAAVALGNVGDSPDEEPSVFIDTKTYENTDAAALALESGEVDAVLVEANEVIVENVGGFGESPLVTLLQRGAASVELEILVAETGQAAADVVDLLTSDPLKTTTLTGQEAGNPSAGFVAYAGLMMLYIAILLYGTWILSGVTEEKSNRVVEVLLSSVKPWQLLAGKIGGIGVLGIGQFAVTITAAVVAIRVTGGLDLPAVSVLNIVNLIVWFVIGFLLYAMMFGAAGSLVSRMEDAQNVAFPMSMIAVAGFFVSLTALDNPDGVGAVIGSLIPVTAPFVVPVRAAFDAIPGWQYALSILIALGSIIGLTFVAGRIYSGALLRFGGRTKLKEAWRSAAD